MWEKGQVLAQIDSHLRDANMGLDAEQHDVGRLASEAVQVCQHLTRAHREQLLLEDWGLRRNSVAQREGWKRGGAARQCCGGREDAEKLILLCQVLPGVFFVFNFSQGRWAEGKMLQLDECL